MSIKLSEQERGEIATKGFVVDTLEAFGYRLESRLESRLEEKLEEKLEKKLDEKLEEKFTKFSNEFYIHVQALMEDNRSSIRALVEKYDHDHENLGKRVDITENRLDRIESKIF